MIRPPFQPSTYVDRRAALRQALGSGVVLFVGNEESPANYVDNPFPFRQDSTFLYYFGLARPGLAALLDLDEGTETLFGDDATIDEIVWMGSQPTLAEMARAAGLAEGDIAAGGALSDAVAAVGGAGRRVHHLPAYRPEHDVELGRLLGARPGEEAPGGSPDLIRAIVAQRSIKTAEEIEEIERAVTISAEMHRTVMERARPGMIERELVAAAEEVASRHGGRPSFQTILTINGQTLHNHDYSNRLERGRLLLCDCGAETAAGYAGDLSRTSPVDPTFTARQREVYEIALAAHMAAVAKLAPGVRYLDIHLEACRTLAAGLKDLGLMKGDPEEAVAAGAHALFFPCGTGHMMGLDVHDMENLGEDFVGYDDTVKRSSQFGLKSLRLVRALEPGFVFTVEPGIYFIPELTDIWRAESRHADFIDYERVEAYRDFGGLRSEENFVITEDGARRLGPDLPKTVDAVEAVRSGA